MEFGKKQSQHNSSTRYCFSVLILAHENLHRSCPLVYLALAAYYPMIKISVSVGFMYFLWCVYCFTKLINHISSFNIMRSFSMDSARRSLRALDVPRALYSPKYISYWVHLNIMKSLRWYTSQVTICTRYIGGFKYMKTLYYKYGGSYCGMGGIYARISV
jgi:hypothetical protein